MPKAIEDNCSTVPENELVEQCKSLNQPQRDRVANTLGRSKRVPLSDSLSGNCRNCYLSLRRDSALGSATHWNRHDVVRCLLEFKIAASIKMKLTWFAAAQAQTQKAIVGQESNGAHDSRGPIPLGIDINQAQNEVVLTLHCCS